MFELQNLKSSDIAEFSFDGHEFVAKVVDINDGDTCKLIFNFNGNFVKYTCRLLGLDCPEMKPSLTLKNRENEIRNAKQSRNRLIQLVTDQSILIDDQTTTKHGIQKIIDNNMKLVKIKCGPFDKYGRLLVTIFNYDENLVGGGLTQSINEILLEEKYA